MLSKIQSLPRNPVETSIVSNQCQENENKRVISTFLPPLPIINTKSLILFQIRCNKYMKKQPLRTQEEHEQLIRNRLRRKPKVTPESYQVKVASKYFGKKITVLKTSNDAARLYQKSKYLTKIAVCGRGPSQTFNFLGREAPSTTVCKFMVMNGEFRSKGSSILLDKEIQVPKDCQYKLLPVYCRRAGQPTTLNLNWSWFKMMSSIKQVRLCLKNSKHYHAEIAVDDKSVKTFKLSLMYQNTEQDADRDFMQSFILQISQQSSLSEVDVDLTSFAKDFKIKFLTLLGESNMLRWHIKDFIEDANELYAEKCTKMLNEADFIHFLGLDSEYTVRISDDLHYQQNQILLSQRIAGFRAESRKRLTLEHS